MPLPYLTQARAPLTCDIDVVNEYGDPLQIAIPAERPLTVYVDKRELVTLMTLGAHPELLVLGYLRNQRLVRDAADIESITVDWDVGAAAVKTRHGIADIEEKTARKVVTTGCGQGSVFGGLMDEVDQIALPADACITQAQLYGLVNTIRLKETTYKSAGSVHACALFSLAAAEPEMLLFVEDVGRHNAIDTIAGWMAINLLAPTLPTARTFGGALPLAREKGALRLRPGEAGSAALAGEEGTSLVFYTTGRLTSEMVIKSAQMGVPIVVSRSGITQMGHQVAQAVGLCAIGRATNRRFVCYAQPQRLKLQPDLAGPRLRAPETA
ncbi:MULTISPECIES: formate dehydrogenase accessory sulfurtransferase FdhD [unclassified Polaromonas]|jgi:FdhD protein|uniref:formate dehydrogenase accessory sulfurtransferase FdhD n=1 Tax=unclassified Polaromonas TaxID=2638319 RepID=UPI000BD34B90|nr:MULTISPECIES: formate dehydrogenase accessory sulfurtransferase FdhD [unclassified Polaromonas]OYY36021.1 MAG: sulfurtransferase FdhD [Polaromonas sp. 35-63-35]OYZ19674.1 MAG: sulfurtransferase FdhD [Polaromonas sp. 16-63-31]OYZ80059.1 MAG: sulfurtransferase FdhD [Polaromonas sp. 24-63-21]OZA52176.1 MAG: sulfurtransferase FdhD [Polaromonas sp. 17-63-33]OZA87792.1 MAG: sulfurtransferase FdhD [Polaromonas sp. 39-63-25]